MFCISVLARVREQHSRREESICCVSFTQKDVFQNGVISDAQIDQHTSSRKTNIGSELYSRLLFEND